ncbi:MAG: T9SS type A sorting domain-containing protein, partial [Bacteroidota bacterium]|nr:T9SS type A sorting domain-containing protein [Bacteroidota bacterium]
YPNPFNPTTSISYQLQKPGYVTLKVFDPTGEEAATLVDGPKDAGTHVVRFSGESLPAGTYIYQLNVDGQILQKKMVLMK